MKNHYLLLCLLLSSLFTFSLKAQVELNLLASYDAGGEGNAEVVAYDATTQRAFFTSSENNSFSIVDISDPAAPQLIQEISLSDFGGGPNSIATANGVVAVAMENDDKQADGQVVLFDIDGTFQAAVPAGALPDMLTFTPDGSTILVANEGEPSDDYTVDPEGSITVIDVISQSGTTYGFTAFNDRKESLVNRGIRIFGNNDSSTVAQDLEPEYIALTADGSIAYVNCQENNAIAVFDIAEGVFDTLLPLGYKDHSLEENAFDASNRDDAINITTHPTLGMFQPDAITTYEVDGMTYILTANEGDARDYDGYSEEVRVADLLLDSIAYPNAAELQDDANLGRLKTTTATGDYDGDGDIDQIYSFGARSFSIFDQYGNLVYDSSMDFANIVSDIEPELFNEDDGDFDDRSDDKGVEPEAIAVGTIDDRTYAFVGLERQSGIIVYDITDPTAPSYVTYYSTRMVGDEITGDVSPEIIEFISAEDSPNGEPILLVGYEVSGTMATIGLGEPMVEENPECPSPTGITLRDNGRRVTVRWNRVKDVRGYELEVVDGNGNTFAIPVSRNKIYLTAGFTSDFTIRVRVLCDNGEVSAWSLPITVASRANGRSTNRKGIEAREELTVEDVFAYPNPVSDMLISEFKLTASSAVSSYIQDVSGRIVENRSTQLFRAGNHRIKYDMSGVSPGTYILTTIIDGEQQNEILIKQ